MSPELFSKCVFIMNVVIKREMVPLLELRSIGDFSLKISSDWSNETPVELSQS